MNFKLKALTVAAVAAMSLSGAANAVNNNDMFLIAYDSANVKTFIAGLSDFGVTNTFDGAVNSSRSFAADANWAAFNSGNANAASVTWQVLGAFQSNGVAVTSYNALDEIVFTSAGTPGLFSNSQMNGLMADWATPSGVMGQFRSLNSAVTGTATALVAGTGFDSGAAANTNFFTKLLNSGDTTAALGQNLSFWDVTRPAASGNTIQQIKTKFVQGDGTADFWNLNAAGLLTYTGASVAAVPEADTSAMMLAGLGLMGFVARRRKA
jgi:PEP-CTERM motif